MSRDGVLSSLLQGRGSWASGEEIAADLGVTRAAVWKQIRSLRASGYEIEASPGKGYRLVVQPDSLRPEVICGGLGTEFVGKVIHYRPVVGSTNDVARKMAREAEEGTVILAEVQTEGRGRMGRRWQSPPGGVWMSVILKPDIPPALASRINIAVGLAVARTLSHLYGLEAGIKWPNDLTVRDKKVCGILTEMGAEIDRLDYVVVGIGINANMDPDRLDVEGGITSISRELGGEVSRTELVQKLLWNIEKAYIEVNSSFPKAHAEWSARSSTLGRRVRIVSRRNEFEGIAVELDRYGALRIRRDDGEIVRVLAGDCVHLRPAEEEEEEEGAFATSG